MLVRQALVWGAIAVSAAAQVSYPGQTNPYPGQTGPYPGGQTGPYPGGTGGPFPGGRGGRGGRNGPDAGGPGKSRKADVIPISTTGMLRAVRGDQFAFEADDHRIITYKFTDQTRVERDGKPTVLTSFDAGDHLTVDSTADANGFFTAVSVTFQSPGTPSAIAAAARTWDLPVFGKRASSSSDKRNSGSADDDDRPVVRRKSEKAGSTAEKNESEPVTSNPQASSPAADETAERPATTMRPPDAAPDPDDPGRPQLRRGRPAQRATARELERESPVRSQTGTSQAQETSAAITTRSEPAAPPEITPIPTIPIQEDPIIVKAREAAAQHVGTLPNFLVRQVATRYDADNPKQGWQARDIVSADLTYENGAENYKNIKVGSKSVKSMEETGGTWSTGEFSGVLEEIFRESTAARFRKSGQETIQNRRADVFKFEVKRENARWRIVAPSQLYIPAYRGSLWIDRETSRVLRLEIESRNIPPLFPFSKAEIAVDYDLVRLGTTQRFLLPTVAEVLSCEQGSPRCVRNRIEFRNYKKFGAESDISFDDNQ